MLYGSKRETYRQVFIDQWQRYRQGLPPDGIGQRIVAVILEHPEYHGLLEHPDQALAANFSPVQGETNPFAHMGLHVALLELLANAQPAGIVEAFARLTARLDRHAAEHVFVECLGELIWQGQRVGREPDLQELLPCVRRLHPDDGTGKRRFGRDPDDGL
ncbi:MAG: DUF1841 family protein [Acidithiobacillus sp.]